MRELSPASQVSAAQAERAGAGVCGRVQSRLGPRHRHIVTLPLRAQGTAHVTSGASIMGCVFSKPSEGASTKERRQGLLVQQNEFINNNEHQVRMNHR